MLHEHVPQFISHFASAGRHALIYGHAAWRAFVGVLFQLESPRDAFRVALRRVNSSRAGRESARPKPAFLIHYHIFKNAGSSFEHALDRVFAKGFRQFDSPDPGGTISYREIAQLVKAEPYLRAISSHQAVPPPPRIAGRKIITSILIRDPIARIRSIYAFERSQQAETPGARSAKQLDFAGYVKWRLESSPTMFCNYQVRFCAGRPRASGPCSEAELETAIIRLDAMDIVGTVQRYNEWIALAQSVLSRYFELVSLPVVHENRSSPQTVQWETEILSHLVQELGPELVDELLQKNEMDMRLHQIADSLLTRKLAEADVVVNLGKTYARVRNEIGVSRNSLRK